MFSSHILGEVQRICDRVAIIKEGRIISTQKISELQENAYKKVSFTSKNPVENFTLRGAKDVVITDKTVTFVFKGDCNELLASMNQSALTNVDITEPSLEEIFLHYYV